MSRQVFLITGGTGTFGNAMASRLLTSGQDCQVRILSRDEVKQGDMRARLKDDSRLRFLLGDVRDRARLEEAMEGVDVVFHAAAMKRVEACAYDPGEAIRTNVFGSMNVAAAARAARVRRVVALSSDKACAPSTTYGATKLCMEAVFTSSTANVLHEPLFCVLRYGNVMGSRGSVVERWRELLKADPDAAVPITRLGATRFWFSVTGAVNLALFAAGWSRGGELVVPCLPAFSIGDLATAMNVRESSPMAMRPGEKLHEAMVSADEANDFEVVTTPVGSLLVRFPGRPPRSGLIPPFVSDQARRLTVEELRSLIRSESCIHDYEEIGRCIKCGACQMCGSPVCDLRFHTNYLGEED